MRSGLEDGEGDYKDAVQYQTVISPRSNRTYTVQNHQFQEIKMKKNQILHIYTTKDSEGTTTDDRCLHLQNSSLTQSPKYSNQAVRNIMVNTKMYVILGGH